MWSASRRCVTSSRSLSSAPDPSVQEHRCEQDPALEGEGPVAVPLRVDDPELHHPEHGRAEERADHRTKTPCQEAATYDRTDDEDELQADALSRLHRAQLERLDDAHERGRRGRHHEEQDLRASHRNAHVARRARLAAGAVDPVAEAGLGKEPGTDEGDTDPPENLDLEGVVGEIAREDLVCGIEP